jgi:hypothetical protein
VNGRKGRWRRDRQDAAAIYFTYLPIVCSGRSHIVTAKGPVIAAVTDRHWNPLPAIP